MTEFSTIASFIGAILAFMSAGLSVSSLIKKRDAEKKLVSLIKQHRDDLNKLAVTVNREQRESVTAREDLTEAIKRFAGELGDRDRALVIGPLTQTSDKGREEYVKKLLSAAM